MTIHYEFLQPEHFARFVELANRVHGDNYIDLTTLETYAQRSVKNHINASIVALDEERMVGFRLTFAAGQWPFDKWCSVDKWPVAADDMCYFKVIAVDPEYQGSGVGGELLKRSIEQAKQQGAKAGLAHVWEESPGNNAVGYFRACGGELVARHPGRWLVNVIEDGYVCPICESGCDCVAAEMVIPFAAD